jgi:predicted 3-demethylubiquinone-9 3-methyltransferase (glyoxalase superfamily)
MEKITPFLWFDNNAEQAAKFYVSVFNKSKIGKVTRYDKASAKASGQKEGSVMTIGFQLRGQAFTGLNGGPIFKFTPAISFLVHCKTAREVDELFKKLSKGGEIMMPLDAYPFSKRYAFIKDKFGVAWQIIFDKQTHITPALLFVGKSYGKAKDAVKFYTSVFKQAKVEAMHLYEDKRLVMYSSFLLEGREFSAMDGKGEHKFSFNESISFAVNCDTQKEIDYYWKKLSADKKSEQCGWLKDKFGISWQIVPSTLPKLISSARSPRLMQELMQMKKLDLKRLQQAAKQ